MCVFENKGKGFGWVSSVLSQVWQTSNVHFYGCIYLCDIFLLPDDPYDRPFTDSWLHILLGFDMTCIRMFF